MSAQDRYSASDSTLDGVIESLTQARAGGARGDSVVMAWDPESERPEPITGFVIETAHWPARISFHTDEP